MSKTLEQETFEELNEYKLTFETNTNLENTEANLETSFSEFENSNTNIEDEDEEQTVECAESCEQPIECTALVTVKEQRLLTAQKMFKKSIKFSIKSFLISLSLSFLNLFI